MWRFCSLLFFCLCYITQVFAQQATIHGAIINYQTKETLPGVNIIVDSVTGVVSDNEGKYSIKVNPGKVRLTYKCMGFSTMVKAFTVTAGQDISSDVSLAEISLIIEGVVVSAGKFEQKISDVTISMNVMKPQQIENQNINNVSEALNKIPGVDIMESTPSIRGGCGYSYGTGSRVLVMVDDMPLMGPDGGDAKWNFIPLENISQIEVLKGASSALFGSSALNGVIHVRTKYPGNQPSTKITINNGIYMNPKRKELIWWDTEKGSFDGFTFPNLLGLNAYIPVNRPGFSGVNFLHSRKINDVDLVIGANGYKNEDFKQYTYEQHARVNMNLRYRPKKVQGLSVGINTNYMTTYTSDFFLWQNADSGAWKPNPATISENHGYRFNTDPFVLYFDKKGNRQSLRTRYFRTVSKFVKATDKDNIADQFYGDYQYQKNIKNKVNWTAGISGSYTNTSAVLFGEHKGMNFSLYSQFDARLWKRLAVSLGIRGEYFNLDDNDAVSSYEMNLFNSVFKMPVRPVLRAGVNYQVAEYTFIRTSYGQGYRFPSIAERFVKASMGGMNIFPNPGLVPETGWSAEVGAKQGFKLGTWNGFADAAGFWTEYKNMVEFTFGIFKPDTAEYACLDDIGFKSINVGNARITGVDVSVGAEGTILGFPASFMIGYTYTNPVDLNYDPEKDTSGTVNSRMLKYRYYHSVKADFEVDFHRINFGADFQYTSNMVNIDKIFGEEIIPGIPSTTIIPGLNKYREEHNKGYYVINIRCAYDITEKMKLGLIVKNLLNKEYMARPGLIEAPRNLAIQYSLTI